MENPIRQAVSHFLNNLKAEMSLSVVEPPPDVLIPRLREICAQKDATIAALEARIAELEQEVSYHNVNNSR